MFDRPIGQNQGIAFPLAQAHAQLRAAGMMIREAGRLIDAGLPCGEEANLAKYLAAEAGLLRGGPRPCRPSAGSGTPPSTTSSATSARPACPRIAPISQELILAYVAEHVLGLPRSH